jgi:hypothetical protein
MLRSRTFHEPLLAGEGYNVFRVIFVVIFFSAWAALYVLIHGWLNPPIGSYASIALAVFFGFLGAYYVAMYGFAHLFVGLPALILILMMLPLSGIEKLFVKYKMEGVFLCVGAVLFLCSKALIIRHLI